MKGNAKPEYTKVEDLPAPRKGRGGYRDKSPEQRCSYTTPDGTPCRAARRRNSNFCIGHDQAWQEQRKLAFALRREATSADDVSTSEGIHHLIQVTIEDLREGRIPVNVANSIGYLAQLLMTNLPPLVKERKANDADDVNVVDIHKRFRQVVADGLLEEQEKEIRSLGDDAYPLQAAKKYADSLRKQGKLKLEDLIRVVRRAYGDSGPPPAASVQVPPSPSAAAAPQPPAPGGSTDPLADFLEQEAALHPPEKEK
jgi:hypothetical protein